MQIVFFDFDGTLTSKDSFVQFIRFAVGGFNVIIGLVVLSPLLILYKLKVVSNYKAKQIMLTWFFKGYSEKRLKKIARNFSLNRIDKILRPQAIERLDWHKRQKHKIVIVSASLDCWLEPWCEKNNFDLIATKLEVKKGIITGKLSTKNCYGLEKFNRINEKYNLKKFEYIYAYGDSLGDKEMLAIAHKSFYKPFRN